MAKDVTWRAGWNREELEPTERKFEQKKGNKRGRKDYQQEGFLDCKEEEDKTNKSYGKRNYLRH